MSLSSRIGNRPPTGSLQVESLPNGLIRLFDVGSKLHLLIDHKGNRRGGNLILSKEEIRRLTGIQI